MTSDGYDTKLEDSTDFQFKIHTVGVFLIPPLVWTLGFHRGLGFFLPNCGKSFFHKGLGIFRPRGNKKHTYGKL